MDEFDIEVTDLREQHATTISAGHHTGHDDHDLTQSGVQSRLGKRVSRRQRLVRALAVVATILLALALILGANPTTRAALDTLLHPDTTFSNSTTPASEQFDLVHIAPWGELRIDGQSVPQKQVLQRFRAITLAPGTHTLDYSAPPFSPLHCVLTVPVDLTTDTCPLTQNANDLYPAQNDNVRMLDLRAGFTNLSGQQLATLINAASAGLVAGSPTAIVAPGEHYLTANGEVATNTNRPMQATLLYQLSYDRVLLPDFEDLHCQTLCFYRSLINRAPDEWGVVAHVTLSWSYVVPHGVLYGPITPDHDTMDAGVPLHITWQHGWHVAPLSYTGQANAGIAGNPICVPAQDAVSQVLVRMPGISGSSSNVLPTPATTSCLIMVGDLTIASHTEKLPCYLLYRFGILLAANDEAHRIFPTFPLADASERALGAPWVDR